jgi:hypothetical protein
VTTRPGRRPGGRQLRRLALASGIVVLAGAAARLAAHDPLKTRVTWTGDIARIVSARCVSCHHAGAADTMSLATYEDARPWARAIKEEVLTRRMPIWHAARGYGDFVNDPSLSAFDIALVAAWADNGAPRGTDADADRKEAHGSVPTPTAPPAGAREITLACGEQPAPEGRLLAVRPSLAKGGDVGLAMRLPGNRSEIVGWIRDYDPRFPVTYQLRIPLAIPPTAVLSAQPATPGCSITLTVLQP